MAKPATRRSGSVFQSAAPRRSEGLLSYRNRLDSISVARMASLVAIKGHPTLAGSPPKSVWLVLETVVSRPSLMFLLF